MVAVPITAVKPKDNTPTTLQKYEPFFKMIKADKIPIVHMQNSETGVNDVTMVVFDMRQFAEGKSGLPVLQQQVQGGEVAPVGVGLQQLLAEKQANLPEVE